MKHSARSGLTLLELLLVMLLLGLVLGTGVGMFAALDLGRRQAESTVRAVLRSTHFSAVASQSPARVRIDRARGELQAESLQVVGTWQFEGPRLQGAFGLDGVVFGAEFVDDGFIGRALSFHRSGGGAADRPRAEIPLREGAGEGLRAGFRIECAVKLEQASGGTLLTLGRSCGLRVEPGGLVRGWLAREELDVAGGAMRGALVSADSPAAALPSGRWVRLAFEYDRAHARLSIDGELVAELAETAPVWPLDGPLLLSHRTQPFQGSLDNLVLSTVAGSEIARLPDTVAFASDAPEEIRFDAGGGLDRAFHDGAVQLGLVYESGEQRRVRVGLYGTVE